MDGRATNESQPNDSKSKSGIRKSFPHERRIVLRSKGSRMWAGTKIPQKTNFKRNCMQENIDLCYNAIIYRGVKESASGQEWKRQKAKSLYCIDKFHCYYNSFVVVCFLVNDFSTSFANLCAGHTHLSLSVCVCFRLFLACLLACAHAHFAHLLNENNEKKTNPKHEKIKIITTRKQLPCRFYLQTTIPWVENKTSEPI